MNINDFRLISTILCLLMIFSIEPITMYIFLSFIVGFFVCCNNFNIESNKSKLFGINPSKFITSKYGIAIIEGAMVKDKGKYFKVEMVNLFLETQENEIYKTVSQSIVVRTLKLLEKEGYVKNLEYKEEMMSYEEELLEHIAINFGIGNFKNLCKVNKKYNIKFIRTSKVIDDEFIKNFLLNDYKILYKDDNLDVINKVKYINNYNFFEEKKYNYDNDVLEESREVVKSKVKKR